MRKGQNNKITEYQLVIFYHLTIVGLRKAGAVGYLLYKNAYTLKSCYTTLCK